MRRSSGIRGNVLPIIIAPRRLAEGEMLPEGTSPADVVPMAHQLAADFANAEWLASGSHPDP